MRKLILFSVVFLAWLAGPAAAQVGELQVEIRNPADGLQLTRWETSLAVEGGASVFGGVRFLDLFLVLDTSRSLKETDPRDYRVSGASALVRSLPAKSDIQIGVVGFDHSAELVSPLTTDRSAVVRGIEGLRRSGRTDLAEGILTALRGLQDGMRPDSSRVILLFTDGKSDEDEAREAMREARRRGVAIHTLLLGRDKDGASILREIAEGTGGSFLRVSDPARLPEAFLSLRTTGIDKVVLRANGGAPIPARLVGGGFSAEVPLHVGENEIMATATSLDGRVRDRAVRVTVSGPLTVAIDSPADGTEYERAGETVVQGTVITYAQAPAGFTAGHPNRGVESVVLELSDGTTIPAELRDGRFRARLPLSDGETRIVARATAVGGASGHDAIRVAVRLPGCGELSVAAMRDGEPALSISDRAVELVFDASGSMWARMEGRTKIEVAKEILGGALDWMPRDLSLGLRVYGHQHAREEKDCTDSELMVPLGTHNREAIRGAVTRFKPRGQTPLALSIEQVGADLAGFRGERAVVLITDGIESCGGDPVAAARALQRDGSVPVHVIGFGLGGADEDAASLRAIAEASGGRFIAAGSADELRRALAETVGTPFEVRRGGRPVARGTLGREDLVRLPAGEYVVRLESEPPHEVPVTLTGEEHTALVLERRGDAVEHATQRRPATYHSCEAPLPADM